MSQKEIWKDVDGYEGLYQVSSFGRVKSLRRNIVMAQRTDRKGYNTFLLCKDGIPKSFKAHRLVAQAFIPNSNKPQVNHKDGNKSNNCVSNLEWATDIENKEHAMRTGLRHAAPQYSSIRSEPVMLVFNHNQVLGLFKNARAAAKIFGIDELHIGKSCNGRFKSELTCWEYLNMPRLQAKA